MEGRCQGKVFGCVSILLHLSVCSSRFVFGTSQLQTPLTDHLLKSANRYDNSLIGFHRINTLNQSKFDLSPNRPVKIKVEVDRSKLAEYISYINRVRNIVENENIKSRKVKKVSYEPSSFKSLVNNASSGKNAQNENVENDNFSIVSLIQNLTIGKSLDSNENMLNQVSKISKSNDNSIAHTFQDIINTKQHGKNQPFKTSSYLKLRECGISHRNKTKKITHNSAAVAVGQNSLKVGQELYDQSSVTGVKEFSSQNISNPNRNDINSSSSPINQNLKLATTHNMTSNSNEKAVSQEGLKMNHFLLNRTHTKPLSMNSSQALNIATSKNSDMSTTNPLQLSSAAYELNCSEPVSNNEIIVEKPILPGQQILVRSDDQYINLYNKSLQSDKRYYVEDVKVSLLNTTNNKIINNETADGASRPIDASYENHRKILKSNISSFPRSEKVTGYNEPKDTQKFQDIRAGNKVTNFYESNPGYLYRNLKTKPIKNNKSKLLNKYKTVVPNLKTQFSKDVTKNRVATAAKSPLQNKQSLKHKLIPGEESTKLTSFGPKSVSLDFPDNTVGKLHHNTPPLKKGKSENGRFEASQIGTNLADTEQPTEPQIINFESALPLLNRMVIQNQLKTRQHNINNYLPMMKNKNDISINDTSEQTLTNDIKSDNFIKENSFTNMGEPNIIISKPVLPDIHSKKINPMILGFQPLNIQKPPQPNMLDQFYKSKLDSILSNTKIYKYNNYPNGSKEQYPWLFINDRQRADEFSNFDLTTYKSGSPKSQDVFHPYINDSNQSSSKPHLNLAGINKLINTSALGFNYNVPAMQRQKELLEINMWKMSHMNDLPVKGKGNGRTNEPITSKGKKIPANLLERTPTKATNKTNDRVDNEFEYKENEKEPNYPDNDGSSTIISEKKMQNNSKEFQIIPAKLNDKNYRNEQANKFKDLENDKKKFDSDNFRNELQVKDLYYEEKIDRKLQKSLASNSEDDLENNVSYEKKEDLFNLIQKNFALSNDFNNSLEEDGKMNSSKFIQLQDSGDIASVNNGKLVPSNKRTHVSKNIKQLEGSGLSSRIDRPGKNMFCPRHNEPKIDNVASQGNLRLYEKTVPKKYFSYGDRLGKHKHKATDSVKHSTSFEHLDKSFNQSTCSKGQNRGTGERNQGEGINPEEGGTGHGEAKVPEAEDEGMPRGATQDKHNTKANDKLIPPALPSPQLSSDKDQLKYYSKLNLQPPGSLNILENNGGLPLEKTNQGRKPPDLDYDEKKLKQSEDTDLNADKSVDKDSSQKLNLGNEGVINDHNLNVAVLNDSTNGLGLESLNQINGTKIESVQGDNYEKENEGLNYDKENNRKLIIGTNEEIKEKTLGKERQCSDGIDEQNGERYDDQNLGSQVYDSERDKGLGHMSEETPIKIKMINDKMQQNNGSLESEEISLGYRDELKSNSNSKYFEVCPKNVMDTQPAILHGTSKSQLLNRNVIGSRMTPISNYIKETRFRGSPRHLDSLSTHGGYNRNIRPYGRFPYKTNFNPTQEGNSHINDVSEDSNKYRRDTGTALTPNNDFNLNSEDEAEYYKGYKLPLDLIEMPVRLNPFFKENIYFEGPANNMGTTNINQRIKDFKQFFPLKRRYRIPEKFFHNTLKLPGLEVKKPDMYAENNPLKKQLELILSSKKGPRDEHNPSGVGPLGTDSSNI